MQNIKILCFSALLINLNFLPIYSSETYTPSEVVKKVFEGNKKLKANKHLIKAAEENLKQAKAISNPEIEVGLENFGTSEIEVLLAQPIELGGKRKKRIHYVNKEIEISRLSFESKKNEIEAKVFRDIIPILALNSDILILESIINVVDSTRLLIEKRINAGANNKVDVLRASMELEQLDLQKEMLEAEKIKRSNNLSLLWGDTSDNQISIKGTINSEIEIPDLQIYKEKYLSHPELRKMKMERELSNIELEQSQKNVIPDIEISGGYLRNNEANENSILLGASLELPIFNRNRGEIKNLEVAIEAQGYENEGIKTERLKEILNIYYELQRIDSQIKGIKEKILPKSSEIFETVITYYGNGAISFLDVLEAQREDLELHLAINELEKDRAMLLNDLFELTDYKVEIFKISN